MGQIEIGDDMLWSGSGRDGLLQYVKVMDRVEGSQNHWQGMLHGANDGGSPLARAVHGDNLVSIRPPPHRKP